MGHWKKVKKYIFENTGQTLSAQEVYDVLYPDQLISCDLAKFKCFSVGYATCQKGCDCYTQRLSAKMSEVARGFSTEKREKIRNTRALTVEQKYGVSNVFQLALVKQKSSDTKLSKYGTPTFNNSEKTKKTLIEKYGVKNVMQVKCIAAKNLSNRNSLDAAQRTAVTKLKKYNNSAYNNRVKAAATNLKKYGTTNPSKSQQVKQQISDSLRTLHVQRHSTKYQITAQWPAADYQPLQNNVWICNKCGSKIAGKILNGKFTRCRVCNPTGSLPENQIKDYLRTLGVTLVENTRNLIPPKEIDIYLPDHKLAIEYCGLYWHRQQQGKHKHYHIGKLLACHQQGIKLITIFGNQWDQFPDLIKSRLAHLLNCQANKVFARKCKIVSLTRQQARDFFNNNHLHGYCNARHSLGLIYQGQLVSAMLFSTAKFDQRKTDLVRFSNLQNFAIVGAASRLLNAYICKHKPREIVAYSDNNWGLTDFYNKLGFDTVSFGSPGYQIINVQTHQIHDRLKFQKHKLSKMGITLNNQKTTYENILANGFDRIWDCGHSKHVLKLTG